MHDSLTGPRRSHRTESKQCIKDRDGAAEAQTVGRTSLFKRKGKNGGRKKRERGREEGRKQGRKKRGKEEEKKGREEGWEENLMMTLAYDPPQVLQCETE